MKVRGGSVTYQPHWISLHAFIFNHIHGTKLIISYLVWAILNDNTPMVKRCPSFVFHVFKSATFITTLSSSINFIHLYAYSSILIHKWNFIKFHKLTWISSHFYPFHPILFINLQLFWSIVTQFTQFCPFSFIFINAILIHFHPLFPLLFKVIQIHTEPLERSWWRRDATISKYFVESVCF